MQSRFSMPDTSAMAVKSMTDIPEAARAQLIENGYVTALQVVELISRTPKAVRARSGLSAANLRKIFEGILGPLPDFSEIAISSQPMPMPGLPASGSPPEFVPHIMNFNWFTRRLEEIGEGKTDVSLIKRMQPIGNQGQWPACVGWAVAALREYAMKTALSPAYTYLGSKLLDGDDRPGTWMGFALQWQYQIGIVTEKEMPYAKLMAQLDLNTLRDRAAPRRTHGHSMVIPNSQLREQTVPLFRAILEGKLFSRLRPLPIGVSLVLKQSFESTSARLDGIIPMPLASEPTVGGHAMVIVGYIDAKDPRNPFGVSYFVVRNSWGTQWASQNPLAPAGHALIPTAYFEKNLLKEAYICLDDIAIRGLY